VNTSLLNEELAPLNAQIVETRGNLESLETELCKIEAELKIYLAEKQRFEALREVCNALDRLGELEAEELFWHELPDIADAAEYQRRLRGRVASFEEETQGIEVNREAVKAKIELCLYDLEDLDEEVRQAYSREEVRQEEFIIEREVSPVPFMPMIMPWTKGAESERLFRKALLISLFWSVALGTIIPMVAIPIIDRVNVVVEIPARLAMLVKKEPLIPEPLQPRPQKEKKLEPELPKKETSEKTAKIDKKTQKAKPAKKPAGGGGVQVARKKAESTGVLAFKSTFSDLMDEVPVAKLGTEARLNKDSKQIPGQARAQRNLVAMQAKSGTSGGIGNLGVSRNLGNGGAGGGSGYGNAGQIGGVGFSRVESTVAGLAGEEGRPLSGGPGPGRTDEEIQIVFDRYKASLYRIYNKELRKDPTLRGKLLMRLTIEPEGEVSMCVMESTDLDSDELVAQIIGRVKRFNFGPKEDVPRTTILYPIDFLPAT
jgi:hypothetical protein